MSLFYKSSLAAVALATLLACGDDARPLPVTTVITPNLPNHDVPRVGKQEDGIRVWDTSGRTTRIRPPLPSEACNVFFEAIDWTWESLLQRPEAAAFDTCLQTAGVDDLGSEAMRHGCTMEPQPNEAAECASIRQRHAAALDTCKEPIKALAALPHWRMIAAAIESAAEHQCYDMRHGNVPMPH